jgi:hypothetical protein
MKLLQPDKFAQIIGPKRIFDTDNGGFCYEKPGLRYLFIRIDHSLYRILSACAQRLRACTQRI